MLNISRADAASCVSRFGKHSDEREFSHQGGSDWPGLADPSAWLISRGVPSRAIAEPWGIHSASVMFDGLHGFNFHHDGIQALIFKAEDRCEEKDLIAWEPGTGRLASWHGNTFCLGDIDQIYNPATYFMKAALRIHDSPLEWLRAGREGIVVLRRDLSYTHLRFCQRVICDDPAYAMRLEQWLKAPRSTVRILIAEGAQRECP